MKAPRMLMVATVPVTLQGFLLPFADHFRSLGWTVDAMAQGLTSQEELDRSFDHVWDIAWSRNPLDLRNLVVAPGKIQALVQDQGYDLVHVHTPVAAFATRYALRSLRRQPNGPKVIYTAHGFHFHKGGGALHNAAFVALEKIAGCWTDYLVVINRDDESAARRLRLVSPERVCYMPGIGIDRRAWAPERVPEQEIRRVRAELGLSTEPLLLMVAEFNPGKRHRDALAAFARMANPRAHLAFAGAGPTIDAVRHLAHVLGVEQRVHFLGFRRDMPALIRSAAATLLPSEREGLPRSVMESLCLGVPVIGTAIRGMNDLVPPYCGQLVPVGDVAGLTVAMNWVCEHPAAARAAGERGREHMEGFDLPTIMAQHEALYAQALGGRDRATLVETEP